MSSVMKKSSSRFNELLEELISEIPDKSSILQEGGLYSQLKKRLIEKLLEGELDSHLGYRKYSRDGDDNYRNGSYQKSVITDSGVVPINVPRDRLGDFEPQIVSKGEIRLDGLNQKVLSLYAKGMSLSDIRIQVSELYSGADISEAVISRITDAVLDDVKAWQHRPLESIYPIVYFDCLVVNVREDKRIIKKAVYVALGIDKSGRKEILGLWISENEGAKFWLGVFTELKNRGLQDILIACTDNLTGMVESINAVYPKTEHQLCIVHQIRNSCKNVSHKDRKAVCADLKLIYTAPSEDMAMQELDSFGSKWDSKYPHISKSWYNNWSNLSIFLQYPDAIRKVIYTTNAIESANSQFRKVTKNKRIFPNDNAVFKSLYLTIQYIERKWTMPIRFWSEAFAHFSIKFDGRI